MGRLREAGVFCDGLGGGAAEALHQGQARAQLRSQFGLHSADKGAIIRRNPVAIVEGLHELDNRPMVRFQRKAVEGRKLRPDGAVPVCPVEQEAFPIARRQGAFIELSR